MAALPLSLCQAGPTGQAFLSPFLAPPLFSPLAGPAVLPLTEGRSAAPLGFPLSRSQGPTGQYPSLLSPSRSSPAPG
jgi:hypothetical protein